MYPGVDLSCSLSKTANEVDNPRRHQEACKTSNPGVDLSCSLPKAANEIDNPRCPQKTCQPSVKLVKTSQAVSTTRQRRSVEHSNSLVESVSGGHRITQ